MSKRNQWRPKVPETANPAIPAVPTDPNSTPHLEANPASNPSLGAAEGANPGILVPNPQGQANPGPDSANLSDFVSKLSPEQLAKVRSLAASAGISTGPRKSPSGGILVEITIPPEAVEPLAEWARESGESFEVFVSKVAGDAIVNYCFGDWSAVREAPVPAPAPVAATTTTTTATTT
jgi:hypothetical protein